MRLSNFWTLMRDEFGPTYAASLARDQSLAALGGRTVEEALAAGVEPRTVWLALCDAMDVPTDRRHGKEPQPRARR